MCAHVGVQQTLAQEVPVNTEAFPSPLLNALNALGGRAVPCDISNLER